MLVNYKENMQDIQLQMSVILSIPLKLMRVFNYLSMKIQIQHNTEHLRHHNLYFLNFKVILHQFWVKNFFP